MERVSGSAWQRPNSDTRGGKNALDEFSGRESPSHEYLPFPVWESVREWISTPMRLPAASRKTGRLFEVTASTVNGEGGDNREDSASILC
jgi:hypothetical protein